MSDALVAVRGRLGALSVRERGILLDRAQPRDGAVAEDVRGIISQVRADGDAALRRLALRFDGTEPGLLEVPRECWLRAARDLDPALHDALEQAARNIRGVHEALRPAAAEVLTADGIRIGRRPDPLAGA